MDGEYILHWDHVDLVVDGNIINAPMEALSILKHNFCGEYHQICRHSIYYGANKYTISWASFKEKLGPLMCDQLLESRNSDSFCDITEGG